MDVTGTIGSHSRAFVRITAALALSGLVAACAGSSSRPEVRPGAVFSDCRDCPQMVVVPAGSFAMGMDGGEPDRYEGPVRTITFARPFAAGRYEITTGQYRKFVAATKHPTAPTACNASRDGRLEPVPGSDWRDPAYGRPAADDEPVACVTWDDATAYVQWLARETKQPYRLLSEAEWEYVARAGRTGRFAWGDDPSLACREANVFDRSGAKARPDVKAAPADCDDGSAGIARVGSRAANPFGLHDVIGNVWEWVEDCYAMPHPADAPVDGRAQTRVGCDRRGARGGSWISAIERQRPSFRGRDPSTLTSQIFGFRIARDL